MSNDNGKMNQGLSVIVAEEKHLDEIAQCHIRAFPGEFMTLIGKRFIKGFYKLYISQQEGCVFIVLGPSGNVVGVVAGGMPELRRRFSSRRAPLYVLDIGFRAIISSVARRRLFQHIRSAARKILINLRLSSANSVRDEPPADPSGTWSSLLSICTLPEFRGKGVGKSLMEAFRAWSMGKGYKTMRLSVRSHNNAAVQFYRRCGWKVLLENQRGVYFRRTVDRQI